MKQIAPADPGARRSAIVVWIVVATLGTIAVWRLSRYVESLTELGRSDPAAASALFKSRVLPGLWLVAAVSIVAGTVLARHGLQVIRTGEFPAPATRVVRDAPRQSGGTARAVGWLLVTAGILMAIVPLLTVGAMTWALR